MIVIVDMGYGNIGSIQVALERLGKKSILSHDKATISSASHVILPGVGNAKHAMLKLKELQLIDTLRMLTQPTLGICLGMQLFYKSSEEGNTDCLNIIPGCIQKFNTSSHLSIPHMGWNNITIIQENETLFLDTLKNNPKNYCYFVHGYKAPIGKNTVATTEYGETFSAIVEHHNFFGVQFHPEKSGQLGAQLLKNFVRL